MYILINTNILTKNEIKKNTCTFTRERTPIAPYKQKNINIPKYRNTHTYTFTLTITNKNAQKQTYKMIKNYKNIRTNKLTLTLTHILAKITNKTWI